jgi:DNA replication licensing factor MCM5
VTLQSDEIGTSIRDLKSDRVGKLVKIPGIVVAATGIKAKATRITIQCRSCRTTLPNLGIRPGGQEQVLSYRCRSSSLMLGIFLPMSGIFALAALTVAAKRLS